MVHRVLRASIPASPAQSAPRCPAQGNAFIRERLNIFAQPITDHGNCESAASSSRSYISDPLRRSPEGDERRSKGNSEKNPQ